MYMQFYGSTSFTDKVWRKNDEGELVQHGSASMSFMIEDTYWVDTPIVAKQESRQGYAMYNRYYRENYEHLISAVDVGGSIFNVVYQEVNYRQLNTDALNRGATTYHTIVDDSHGMYKMPTFTVPKIVGHDDESSHDDSVRFTWAPLPESQDIADQHRHLSMKDATELNIEQSQHTQGLYELSGNMRYYTWAGDLGRNASQYGNDPAIPATWVSGPEATNLTDVGAGVYHHPGFTHGVGTKFSGNNTGFQYYQNSYNLWAYSYDFYLDIEWEMTAADWYQGGDRYNRPIGNIDEDYAYPMGASNYHSMPFTIDDYMYTGMYKGRYHLWKRNYYNNVSYSDTWTSEALVPLNIPHIIRYYRDNSKDGIGMKRSFDKGKTWEELSIIESSTQQRVGSVYAAYGIPAIVSWTDITYVGSY